MNTILTEQQRVLTKKARKDINKEIDEKAERLANRKFTVEELRIELKYLTNMVEHIAVSVEKETSTVNPTTGNTTHQEAQELFLKAVQGGQ